MHLLIKLHTPLSFTGGLGLYSLSLLMRLKLQFLSVFLLSLISLNLCLNKEVTTVTYRRFRVNPPGLNQSFYPSIIHGIKLFSSQNPSTPLFNQANGGNIYCIDPSHCGSHSESTRIPSRAAIPHFLFFLSFPLQSCMSIMWCLNKHRKKKSKHLSSLHCCCSASQISHPAWLMGNPWVAELLTCEEKAYVFPPLIWRVGCSGGDKPILNSCNKSGGTQPSVIRNRQVMTIHLPPM